MKRPVLNPKGDRRAVVACILRFASNGELQVLFILRAGKDGDRRWSGHVGLPGGHVEAGETDEMAVERECKEEIGLDLKHNAQYLGQLREPRVVPTVHKGVESLLVVSCRVYLLLGCSKCVKSLSHSDLLSLSSVQDNTLVNNSSNNSDNTGETISRNGVSSSSNNNTEGTATSSFRNWFCTSSMSSEKRSSVQPSKNQSNTHKEARGTFELTNSKQCCPTLTLDPKELAAIAWTPLHALTSDEFIKPLHIGSSWDGLHSSVHLPLQDVCLVAGVPQALAETRFQLWGLTLTIINSLLTQCGLRNDPIPHSARL